MDIYFVEQDERKERVEVSETMISNSKEQDMVFGRLIATKIQEIKIWIKRFSAVRNSFLARAFALQAIKMASKISSTAIQTSHRTMSDTTTQLLHDTLARRLRMEAVSDGEAQSWMMVPGDRTRPCTTSYLCYNIKNPMLNGYVLDMN